MTDRNCEKKIMEEIESLREQLKIKDNTQKSISENEELLRISRLLDNKINEFHDLKKKGR